MLIALACALYLAAVAYLYFFQRSFVFHPSGALASPAELGLTGIEVLALKASDGTPLSGWYGPAEAGKPTLLYFQGNAGSLTDRADRFGQIRASGFGLLAMSYRGFPGSGGVPGEAALVSDGLEAFDWLRSRTDRILLYGESLGTGVAVRVAAEREANALILEAPYTAAVDIAHEAYPWVPVSLLMRDKFLSRDAIARVQEPVLIVHGTLDRVVPVEHGRKLFQIAAEPKELVVMEGAGHADLWEHGLWQNVLDFLHKDAVALRPETVRRIPSFAGP